MIKTGLELAKMAKKVAMENKTLYVLGCIGAPMSNNNKDRYQRNLAYNKRKDRSTKICNASADTFGFDCVCFIKALLWGWNGDLDKTYGGATYASNNVPDIDANEMIRRCRDVSTNFKDIRVGEVVWMNDHIGVYVGDGYVAECTPRWADGVQITALHNIAHKHGYNGRHWTKHGRLPWLSYEEPVTPPANTATIKDGDVVKVVSGARFWNGQLVSNFIRKMKWLVEGNPVGKRAIINRSVDGGYAIMSAISTDYLVKVGEHRDEELSVGDTVKMDKNGVVYGTSKRYGSMVYRSTLYVRQINGNRIVISTKKTGAITGAVDKKYLRKI